MEAKSFVPDELVVNHVLDRISQPDAEQFGCILDGFPRTKAQFTALQTAQIAIDRVIIIQCPDNVLLERAKGRRIDPSTGNIYHIDYVKPQSAEIEQNLIQRDMDQNIQQRLDVYHAQHRRFKHVDAVKVNGNKPINEVFADVMNIIKSDALKPALNEQSVTEIKLSECTICLDKAATHCVIPCGHQCGMCIFA